MHHALSLYGEGDRVNSRILTALSTLYMGQKAFDQAYLWGKVSESFQESPEVSSTRLGLYHAIGKARQEQLDEQAAAIVGALEQGSYQAP